jgi:uncharacterized protein (TIGR03437 family)
VGNLSTDFFGYVRPYPSISANRVVDAASFQVGQGLAPGSYISIFGTDLSDATQAETTPFLPLSLSQVSVSFDDAGLQLPGHLHFVSPGQVNVQIPWEFQGHSSVRMKVSVDLLSSALYTVPLAQYSPGIFAVTDANGKGIDSNNPARRRQTIIIYANGLGSLDRQQTSGEPAGSQPLARTSSIPSVKVGGSTAGVDFSGLAPGFVGLYQLNVTLAGDAPTGTQPLTVSIGGVDSKPVNLVVQ